MSNELIVLNSFMISLITLRVLRLVLMPSTWRPTRDYRPFALRGKVQSPGCP